MTTAAALVEAKDSLAREASTSGASRAQILRNLKWFTRQLAPVLEDALQAKLRSSTSMGSSLGIRSSSSSSGSGCGGIGGSSKGWCRSLTNSPLLRRLSPRHYYHHHHQHQYQQHQHQQQHQQQAHILGTPTKLPPSTSVAVGSVIASSCASDVRLARLLLVLTRTSTEQRALHARHFAQHVAVVYEYQIGMLRGVAAVSDVVRFVAELIVKAIKLNFVTELNSRQLNPTLFFLNIPMPRSGSKIVKTQQLSGPGTEFSWRICDMFSRSGLRHNRVGGQDCSNLTISTHFYATSGSPAYSYRPDVYGYRNVIAIESSEHNSGIRLYQLSKLDQDTLEAGGGNTGGDNARRSSGTTTTGVVGSGGNATIVGGIGSCSGSGGSALNSNIIAEQCMDHWHKCYKSLLFLVCDRWEVCDHLENCDSFRVFCSRERIRPVMQLTATTSSSLPPANCSPRDISSLLQTFDILTVTPTGSHIDSPSSIKAHISNGKNPLDPVELTSTSDDAGSSSVFSWSQPTNDSPPNGRGPLLKMYDNPAFVC